MELTKCEIKIIKEELSELQEAIEKFKKNINIMLEEDDDNKEIVPENNNLFSIKEFNRFTGTKPKFLYYKNDKINVHKWKKVAQVILQLALKNVPQNFLPLVDTLYGNKRVWIGSESWNMKEPMLISENIYMESQFSAVDLIKICIKVLEKCSIPLEDIKIELN